MQIVDTLHEATVDTSRITVSGLSAGAYMAHQLIVAYSDVFSGMGAVAGGPFLCSKGTLQGALTCGMRGDPEIDVEQLAACVRFLDRKGLVAPVENLEDARIWIFRGTQDSTVLKAPVEALFDFSLRFTSAENIRYVSHVECRHTMPTDAFDAQVPSLHGDPYIDNVGYDAAGHLLQHLYGPLKARTAAQDHLVRFDQSEFLPLPTLRGMDNSGYVYYPTAALRGRKCKLHVALHGCEQHRSKLGSFFAQNAGYNEWAEANDIIVLYPQTFPTVTPFNFNPKGSWDWFGMTSADFFTRQGIQQRAIFNMVDRLTGHQLTIAGISPSTTKTINGTVATRVRPGLALAA